MLSQRQALPIATLPLGAGNYFAIQAHRHSAPLQIYSLSSRQAKPEQNNSGKHLNRPCQLHINSPNICNRTYTGLNLAKRPVPRTAVSSKIPLGAHFQGLGRERGGAQSNPNLGSGQWTEQGQNPQQTKREIGLQLEPRGRNKRPLSGI